MVTLNQLSRVGIGTYRMSKNNPSHYQALYKAITNGCNLIDTASNYENGDSEKLIGEVIKNAERNSLFIISKAGYISHDNFKLFNNLKGTNHRKDLIDISEDFKHSINPDYLNFQISISLNRLNTNYLDGFLLHSPEYYFEKFDKAIDETEYYNRIGRAFEFLEHKVREGIIRYYGVSSNVMTVNKKPKSTNFEKLLEISNKVSKDNHFKIIQFPFNLCEVDSINDLNTNGNSLIKEANKNKITIIGNRPFNANYNNDVLRLSISDVTKQYFDETLSTLIKDNLLNTLKIQLTDVNEQKKISDFPIIDYIFINWRYLKSEDSLNKLFFSKLLPFINLLYKQQIPEKVNSAFFDFYNVSKEYVSLNNNAQVLQLLEDLGEKKLITNNQDSFHVNLCNKYLSQGLDHVLIGMRKTEYVEEMNNLF
jgi:aryl-alcohol dehydrogenase-like predicted oxidoreductase